MRLNTAIFAIVSLIAAAAPVNAQASENKFESYGMNSNEGESRSDFGKTLKLELTSSNASSLEIAVRERDLSKSAYILVGASKAEAELPWGDSLLVSDIGMVLELPQGEEMLHVDLSGIKREAGMVLRFYFQAISMDSSNAFPLRTSQGVEWTMQDKQDSAKVEGEAYNGTDGDGNADDETYLPLRAQRNEGDGSAASNGDGSPAKDVDGSAPKDGSATESMEDNDGSSASDEGKTPAAGTTQDKLAGHDGNPAGSTQDKRSSHDGSAAGNGDGSVRNEGDAPVEGAVESNKTQKVKDGEVQIAK